MRTSVFRFWCCTGMVLGWLLLSTGLAQAHKVTVFAWVEDGQVHTESKFSGGKRVSGGKIKVLDQKDKMRVEGTTDAQGHFTFPAPSGATALKVILVAGMGHTNQWRISAQELGVGKAEAPALPSHSPAPVAPSNAPAIQPAMDPAAIEHMVENALDRKLAPLRELLAAQEWGLRDVLGGLGYILGLIGLASYLQSRKQREPKAPS